MEAGERIEDRLTDQSSGGAIHRIDCVAHVPVNKLALCLVELAVNNGGRWWRKQPANIFSVFVGHMPVVFELVPDCSGRGKGIRRKRLGEREHYVVANAEGIGLVLAASQLERETDITTVAIYVDNQAVIQGLKNERTKPGHFILDEFNRKVGGLKKRHKDMKLVVRWISGHSGVEGNEEADKEANKAAEGDETGGDELSNIEREGILPRSVTAEKMEYGKELKGRWGELWDESGRKEKMSGIGGFGELRKFAAKTKNLKRQDIRGIIQLRTGHSPLRQHMHKIGKEPGPNCLKCNWGKIWKGKAEAKGRAGKKCKGMEVSYGRGERDARGGKVYEKDREDESDSWRGRKGMRGPEDRHGFTPEHDWGNGGARIMARILTLLFIAYTSIIVHDPTCKGEAGYARVGYALLYKQGHYRLPYHRQPYAIGYLAVLAYPGMRLMLSTKAHSVVRYEFVRSYVETLHFPVGEVLERGIGIRDNG
ncbi:hypothetical protein BKA70DRAFT_1236363 [Coprinopsis sp. MPI-PUGE-AT-0042]|nr:hypothetical protein BKA70DRAFT_1236363 [Coprinopsis sp. MPI-PUGE-AT-0042]